MSASPIPATFLRRLGAAIVDFFVVAAYVYAVGWVCSQSKPLAQALLVPLGLGAFAYPLVTHALYGRTIGKWVMRIKVVQLAGTPIGWNESLRRSSIDGAFQIAWAAGLLTALSSVPESEFAGQGWLELHDRLQPLFPAYVPAVLLAATIWSWSEMLTMLFNRNRRAIHDFIASTIVVRSSGA